MIPRSSWFRMRPPPEINFRHARYVLALCNCSSLCTVRQWIEHLLCETWKIDHPDGRMDYDPSTGMPNSMYQALTMECFPDVAATVVKACEKNINRLRPSLGIRIDTSALPLTVAMPTIFAQHTSLCVPQCTSPLRLK